LSTLIDALGGVTIDVEPGILYDKPCGPVGTWQNQTGSQVKVPGNAYCGSAHNGYSVPTGTAGVQRMQADAANSGGKRSVVWTQGRDVAFIIHTGEQHMDGDWALAYARTRIYSSDQDRALRQQNLLKALRGDLDPCKYASPLSVGPLIQAMGTIQYGFASDIDVTDSQNLQAWAGIAKKIAGNSIQELVLTQTLTGQTWVNIGSHKYPNWWPAWDPKSVAGVQGPNGLVATYLNKAPITTSSSSGC
jgi:anionic cell wall polymer biosynthesis LytR-Cps2A-Psr (LCP) family protein